MPAQVLAALSALAVLQVVGGAAVATRTPAVLSGVLHALAGVAAGATALVAARQGPWGVPAIGFGELMCAAMIAFPRWRLDWSMGAALLALGAVPLVSLLQPTPQTFALDVGTGLACITLLQLWWRYETCPAEERRPLVWQLVAGSVVTLVGLTTSFAAAGATVTALAVLTPLLVVVAAWIGGTRPQVLDVRGVVVRVVVDISTALGLWVAFELLVALWTTAGGTRPTVPGYGLLALVPAVAFHPVRRQLRLVADELLFGVRPDPLAAAGRVAVGVGDDPATGLEALRTALVLPYAAVRVDGLPVTQAGERAEHEHVLPLVLDGERVGELVVGLRPGDLRLPADDAKVLGLAAPLLAQSVRARALADHLQSAREQAASAREEERLRLRRDLHDGLGPRLSGIAFTADAARLSAEDPAESLAHLDRVRAEAVSAIREIRELVYGMRPPALDEVGLVEAIRLQAAVMRAMDGRPMRITVGAAGLPPLGAAVEVAAYRIVVEALHNAARHSGSDRADATLAVVGGSLHLDVVDAGMTGMAWVPGVGLSSMRERAVELGGTLVTGDRRVHAELPLRS
ncbi:histidine kinase [Nocardioides ultimimeridianus]